MSAGDAGDGSNDAGQPVPLQGRESQSLHRIAKNENMWIVDGRREGKSLRKPLP